MTSTILSNIQRRQRESAKATVTAATAKDAAAAIQNVFDKTGVSKWLKVKATGNEVLLKGRTLSGDLEYVVYMPEIDGKRYLSIDLVEDDGLETIHRGVYEVYYGDALAQVGRAFDKVAARAKDIAAFSAAFAKALPMIEAIVVKNGGRK